MLVRTFDSRLQLVPIDDPDELVSPISVRVHECRGRFPDAVGLGGLQVGLNVDLPELDVRVRGRDAPVLLSLGCAPAAGLLREEEYFGHSG